MNVWIFDNILKVFGVILIEVEVWGLCYSGYEMWQRTTGNLFHNLNEISFNDVLYVMVRKDLDIIRRTSFNVRQMSQIM